jgi:hypothetical protein
MSAQMFKKTQPMDRADSSSLVSLDSSNEIVSWIHQKSKLVGPSNNKSLYGYMQKKKLGG